jgi:hypothetical protein
MKSLDSKKKMRYWKIDPQIWNDEKFRRLTLHGKFLFLFTLTHLQMTSLGAMRATVGGMADELGLSREVCQEALEELLSAGMVDFDAGACCLIAKNFLKYNPPESPNAVRGWVKAVEFVPERTLKNELLQQAKAFLEAFPDAFREGYQDDYSEPKNKEQKAKTPPISPKGGMSLAGLRFP